MPSPPGTPEEPVLQEDLRLAGLAQVRDILDGLSVPYILEGGALLGAVREGRLLPWDRDIDLAVPAESLLPVAAALRRQLEDHGFELRRENLEPRSLKISARKAGTEYEIAGRQAAGRWRRRTHYKMPRRFFDRTMEIELAGHRFRCPAPPVDYLRFTYRNWSRTQKSGRFLSYRYFDTWYLITNGIGKIRKSRARRSTR